VVKILARAEKRILFLPLKVHYAVRRVQRTSSSLDESFLKDLIPNFNYEIILNVKELKIIISFLLIEPRGWDSYGRGWDSYDTRIRDLGVIKRFLES
jgi:hypothetical protein